MRDYMIAAIPADGIGPEVIAAGVQFGTDRELVDAAPDRMLLKPETPDVLVATNLLADILSDLAAHAVGQPRHRSHREPELGATHSFHVRAHPGPRFRHRGIANPIATTTTCLPTPDLGRAPTAEVTEAGCARH
jgi:tartrate dehydrogenase/decarboxylase/D-malate dehydrogenase